MRRPCRSRRNLPWISKAAVPALSSAAVGAVVVVAVAGEGAQLPRAVSQPLPLPLGPLMMLVHVSGSAGEGPGAGAGAVVVSVVVVAVVGVGSYAHCPEPKLDTVCETGAASAIMSTSPKPPSFGLDTLMCLWRARSNKTQNAK